MTLEHRSLTTATYDRTLVRNLVSYSEARLRRIEPLAVRRHARLNVSHYMRVDQVVAGSGDDVMTETFTNVEPRDGPIATLPFVIASRLGMFGERHYESLTPGQRIDWVWQDPPGRSGERRAEARYAPPLKRGTPVSYTRLGTTFNAVSFNRRDRLDATDQLSDSENVSAQVGRVYEALTLQVSFPEAHWPTAFRAEARDETGVIDDLETSHVTPHLSVLVRPRAVCLAVSHPLPGYTYRIVWSLPNDEEDELDLDPVQAGMAKEILKRLLEVRTLGQFLPEVEAALDRLRADILATFPPKVGQDALELNLLSYDVGAHGLGVIGSVGHHADGGALASWVVKPGRGIEGQAHRRREVVLFRQSEALELDYYEDLPDSRLEPHTVVVAIPVPWLVTSARYGMVMVSPGLAGV